MSHPSPRPGPLALVLCALGCSSTVNPFFLPPEDSSVDAADAVTRDSLTPDAPPRDGGPPDAVDSGLPLDVPRDTRGTDVPSTDVPRVDAAPRAITGGAASACNDDTDCDPEGALLCADFVYDGFCTADCTNSTSASVERSQCGGAGSTCLEQDETTGDAFCTRSCNPLATTESLGACHPSQVCTGWWYTHDLAPDDPGCLPFCSNDSHCGPGERCNVRVGSCGASAFDATARADGQPCDPSVRVTVPGETEPRNIQCRGVCFRVSSTSTTEGICGSFINTRLTPSCPDDPTTMDPMGPTDEDNLGICVFRACTTDSDCTTPLRCISSPDLPSSLCLYRATP